MKAIFTLLTVIFFSQLSFGQTPPANLEDGLPFRNWVKANFYTGIFDALDSYSDAREKMYSYTENFNDTVECIYSGYKRPNPRGNGVSVLDPINTEHSVPQSYFDDNEPMRSDMHILFPAYDDWNSLRSNYKYKEIPDNETDQWILNTSSTSSTPSSNIDAYSEFDNNGEKYWEPREIRKGDIARAIFYFYTMYPNYDMQQIGDRATFCTWHENDLPDERERTRNTGIISFQRNTNPFIDHPEWANNAWGCNVLVNSTDFSVFNSKVNVFPNPSSDLIQIQIGEWSQYPIKASFISLDGKSTFETNLNSSNSYIDISAASKAAYIISFRDISGNLLGNKRLIVE
ncbi:MAG: endonuclease [Chitinophagales bacterium]